MLLCDICNSGVITAIVRFSILYQTEDLHDLAYEGTKLLICTVVEPGVYLMASAFINMRPLFRWDSKEKPPACHYIQSLRTIKSTQKGRVFEISEYPGICLEERTGLHPSECAVELRVPIPDACRLERELIHVGSRKLHE